MPAYPTPAGSAPRKAALRRQFGRAPTPSLAPQRSRFGAGVLGPVHILTAITILTPYFQSVFVGRCSRCATARNRSQKFKHDTVDMPVTTANGGISARVVGSAYRSPRHRCSVDCLSQARDCNALQVYAHSLQPVAPTSSGAYITTSQSEGADA